MALRDSARGTNLIDYGSFRFDGGFVDLTSSATRYYSLVHSALSSTKLRVIDGLPTSLYDGK